MAQVQAIIRKRATHTVTFFGGKPSEQTTKVLKQAGLTFDGRSKQWYISDDQEQVLSETEVARVFSGQS